MTATMKKIVLATGNAGKVREINKLFAGCGIEVVPQSEFNVPEVPETGTTFVENAIIKARHASYISGLPALADDSGLIVPALHGQPGVRSARYAGEQASSLDNLNLLLKNLTDIENRAAHFYCCLVFIRHHADPDPIIAKGLWQGEITHETAGAGGFGYDPIFFVPSHQCTAAELPQTVKQTISHRGIAIASLRPLLAAELNP